MKRTRIAFLHSVLALLLCVSMLLGTTFAWFTDGVSSTQNVITSGNLDLEMYWTDDLNSGTWYNVEDDAHNTIFSYDNWEPGYTEVKYIKLVNAGKLAMNYQLAFTPQGAVGKLADVINVYYANEGVVLNDRSDLSQLGAIGLLSHVMGGNVTANGTLLAADQQSVLGHPAGEVIVTVAMNMLTTAGNEYKNQSVGNFTITALATQAEFEKDSFGSDYDAGAEFPALLVGNSVTADIAVAGGKTTADVTMVGNGISAIVPAGVAVKDGVDKLTLNITPLESSSTDITVVNQEILIPVDVHIDGVAEDNTTPIIISLGEVLPKYLNIGNYALIHVEDGVNKTMTRVADASALTAHNQYTYDPVTGAVTVAMASFSEVAIVSSMVSKWEGKFDYTWYNADAKELTISNADQLAGFGAIVGGMYGQTKDSFAGQTIKLATDIDLADDEQHNNPDILFYPIGYYNTGDYENGNLKESSVSSFEGTFDGNGHTIKNFYQNTWEMFGDYNSGYPAGSNYYKDAMGLFGYVNGGIVKNLTVDNFSSDGEFTPTGVIAAFADPTAESPVTFENIAITNCNPRVYNTGNGGIIGIAGTDSQTNTGTKAINLQNITVDNTNKITALWGSWDVSCSGLIGMYRGRAQVNLTNCHVAAQIDAYNDVCGNYQYYWYRYSGMVIGSIRTHKVDEKGYTVPDTDTITATGCTVHFGDWNNYYYCELVDNSLASYTHDHQMSRLEQVKEVDVENMTVTLLDGNNTVKAIPTSGRYNYVVVNGAPSTENATCYHFVDGKQHNHVDKGYEDGIDEDGDGKNDLKEDKQHLCLPFNQIFQGYGWGVKNIPVYNGEEYAFPGITILDREVGDSAKKFETKFTNNYLYRVGNKGTVTAGTLFEESANVKPTIQDSGVWVTVQKVNETMDVSGNFTADRENWENGTIQFSGTGVVKVTIQDYQLCEPTSIYLEVVDATNVSTYSELGNRNSVLLDNIDIGEGRTYYLSDSTLYGNGFTFDVTDAKDGDTTNGYIGGNYAIGLKNAVLDNVRIVGEVYTEYGATAKAMYNFPTVLTNGNTVIANSYISNCASPVRAQDGNLEIINSTLEGGNFANLDIRGGVVTLDNVVTINQSNADGSSTSNDKNVVGLGIVFYEANVNSKLVVKTDANGNPLLKQYNCISKEVTFSEMLANNLKNALFNNAHEALQYTDNNGVKWINSGILSMTTGVAEDNVSGIDGYNKKSATISSYEGYVWTPVPTAADVTVAPSKTALEQYTILPKAVFDHEASQNYKAQEVGSNEYCYFNEDTDRLLISFDDGKSKVYDPNILTVNKGVETLKYTVKIDGVDYTGKTITFDTTGTHTATYTYADSYNYGFNSEGELITFTVSYEKTVAIDVVEVAATAKNAKFTFYGYSGESTTPATTITDTKSVSSSSGNLYIMPSSTGNNVESTTIDGITVNCPVVYVDFKDNTSDFNWLYPVFLGVKIEDYADGGTAETATTIVDKTSTAKPGNLTIITTDKPSGGGGWSSGSGKSGSEGKIGSGTYKNLYGWTSGAIGSDKTADTLYGTFSYQDNKGTTYYWVIAFKRVAHECPTTCFTPDTLITLADGTQKQVNELQATDKILAWDFFTGTYVEQDISLLVNHGANQYDVIYTTYSDGSLLKLVGEHGVFDYDLNRFVYITASNVKEYIGHRFVKQNLDGGYDIVTMTDGYAVCEYVEAWSISSAVTSNAFASGLLTVAPPEDFYNWIEMDGKLHYDAEQFMNDVETYGLYTYEDFADYVTYEQFVDWNGAYLKVAVEKGYFTFEYILELIELYKGWMPN